MKVLVVALVALTLCAASSAGSTQPFPPVGADMAVVSLNGSTVTISVSLYPLEPVDTERVKLKVVNECPAGDLTTAQTRQLTGSGTVTFTNAAGSCRAIAYWKGKLFWFGIGSVTYTAN